MQRADGEASRGYRAERNERARREVCEERAETSPAGPTSVYGSAFLTGVCAKARLSFWRQDAV